MKFTKSRLFKIVCICTLITSLYSLNAFAYVRFGGKWPSKNVNYAINTDVPSSYVTPIINAANMWYVNTDINLLRNNSSNINVMAYNYGDQDFDGISYMNGGTSFTGIYSYGNIQLNTYWCGKYSPLELKLVATHEFGHELGLAHNPSNNKCIMYGDSSGGHVWQAYLNNPSLANAPAADDINGINSMY